MWDIMGYMWIGIIIAIIWNGPIRRLCNSKFYIKLYDSTAVRTDNNQQCTVYFVYPKVSYPQYGGSIEPFSLSTYFVWVSGVDFVGMGSLYDRPETYIFPSTFYGKAKHWAELPRSITGVNDPKKAMDNMFFGGNDDYV